MPPRRALRLCFRLALVGLTGAATGCAHRQKAGLSDDFFGGDDDAIMRGVHLSRDGRRLFLSSTEEVVRAAADAMVKKGYSIAQILPEQGLMRTGRVVEGTTANAVLYRLYDFVVEPPESGGVGVQVTATPHIFSNASDISDKPIWKMVDERRRWEEIFQGIGASLGEIPKVTAPGGVLPPEYTTPADTSDEPM